MHLLQGSVTLIRTVLKGDNRVHHVDPGRRAVMARGAALLSFAGTTSVSARAFAEDIEEPTLTRVDVPIKDLPVSLEGFRIVQLSDIHIGPTLREDFLNSVVDRVNALSPNLVAITGDLVDG